MKEYHCFCVSRLYMYGRNLTPEPSLHSWFTRYASDFMFLAYKQEALPHIVSSSWLGDWRDGDLDRDLFLPFFRFSFFDFLDFRDFLLDFAGLLGRVVLSV